MKSALIFIPSAPSAHTLLISWLISYIFICRNMYVCSGKDGARIWFYSQHNGNSILEIRYTKQSRIILSNETVLNGMRERKFWVKYILWKFCLVNSLISWAGHGSCLGLNMLTCDINQQRFEEDVTLRGYCGRRNWNVKVAKYMYFITIHVYTSDHFYCVYVFHISHFLY